MVIRITLPPKRLHRESDPETSVMAAIKASKASTKAVNAIARLMSDGVKRIDEEIWLDCKQAGYFASLATIQHGRLALSEAGLLEYTGETSKTINMGSSREWRATMALHVYVSKLDKESEDG